MRSKADGPAARLGDRTAVAPHRGATGARQRRGPPAGRRRAAAAAVPAPVGGDPVTATGPPPRAAEGFLYRRVGPLALYLGDAREVLAAMPPASVDCLVTSPPFWSLR